MLEVPVQLPGQGERIVLLHGFTQAGEVWRDVAEHLNELGYQVMAPDLPGHGKDSGHDDADLETAADLVVEACGPAIYVGYSLGGRLALHIAARHPELIGGAVFIGARTGLTGDERSSRRREDLSVARRIESGGVDAFLNTWMQQGFNARVPSDSRFFDIRSANRAAGLAASVRHTGLGSQDLELQALAAIDMPVLVLSGEHDMPPVVASALELAALMPGARHLSVEGVGHCIPFELEPDRFAAIIDGYCRSL